MELDSDILITCCPKKPFKVNPNLSRVVDNVFVVYKLKRWHLVDPQYYRNGDFIKNLFRAELYDCIDSEGNASLLISTYPLDNDLTTWRESVLDIVDKARENRVKMSRSESVPEGYDFEMVNNIKKKPRWGQYSMNEFVEEAFGDYVIYYEECVDFDVV